VVLASGLSGPSHYREVAAEIAKLGYDVVLFDGNAEENTRGARVIADIHTALGMPHAVPGKVALLGFSLGGGMELFYATGPLSASQVAVGVFWYPANAFIKNLAGFADRQAVPIFVFAGGKDHFRSDCCTAAHDDELQAAAKSAGKSFELTVYPDADHDFVKGGGHYNDKDYSDALMHTADILKTYLAN
jgi:dienelactone hydrolase